MKNKEKKRLALAASAALLIGGCASSTETASSGSTAKANPAGSAPVKTVARARAGSPPASLTAMPAAASSKGLKRQQANILPS